MTPSVFRRNTLTNYCNATKGPKKTYYEQIVSVELALLETFFELSNDIGLPIPSHLSDIYKGKGKATDYPFDHHIAFISLAQHHGVPTRLLDFTYNPLVAAYIAAEDAFKHRSISKNKRFAIWAVHVPILKDSYRDEDIKLFEPKRYENKNLHNQDGVFIYDRKLNEKWRQSRKRPVFDLAKILSKLNSKYGNLSIDPKIVNYYPSGQLSIIPSKSNKGDFIKATLPINQAWDLLMLLDNKEGLHRAKLMPTYDKVVEALELRRDLRIYLKRMGKTKSS